MASQKVTAVLKVQQQCIFNWKLGKILHLNAIVKNNIERSYVHFGASLVGGSVLKNMPARQELQETQGQEDPLEEGMATHSSILAWRIP